MNKRFEQPNLHVGLEERNSGVLLKDIDFGNAPNEIDIKKSLAEYPDVPQIKFNYYVVNGSRSGYASRPNASA